MNNVIGREEEKEQLANVLQEETPQLVAVYGRRRVGKPSSSAIISSNELYSKYRAFTMVLCRSSWIISRAACINHLK